MQSRIDIILQYGRLTESLACTRAKTANVTFDALKNNIEDWLVPEKSHFTVPTKDTSRVIYKLYIYLNKYSYSVVLVPRPIYFYVHTPYIC